MIAAAYCSRGTANPSNSCFDHTADFVTVLIVIVVAAFLLMTFLQWRWRRQGPDDTKDDNGRLRLALGSAFYRIVRVVTVLLPRRRR
jgi:hypothetical protein